MDGRNSNPVKWACVLLVILMSLSGLALARTGAAATPSPPGTDQVEPDVMRIGFTQEPDSMNPFAGVLSASYWVYDHVFDLLVGIGADLEPVPQLAKNWSVAADNVTWTFNLFDNVYWHDGTPFTSADVKFTFEYIQTCSLALFIGYLGDPTKDPVYISEITTPSDTQVIIKTNVPKANMLSLFVPILPQHIWSGIRCSAAARETYIPPIGTGMYKFKEWVQGAGGYLQLDINMQYHMIPDVLAQNPDMDFVDTIYMQFYATAANVLDDLRAGILDASDALTTRDFVTLEENLDADPEPDVGKFVTDQIALSEIGFCVASDAVIDQYLAPPNGDRHWLVTNLTVRQAIAMATNKQSVIDNAYEGLGKKGDSLIPPATPFWHYFVPEDEEYKFNLTKAAELLNDPTGDGYTLKAGATGPGMKGEGLDPDPVTGANNQDAFADIDGDGIREVINMANVQADGAPQGNENLATTPEEMKFGIWIIDYYTEAQNGMTIVIQDLATIGISVQKIIVSEGEQLRVSYNCDYDLYIWGWGGDVDPDFMLSVMTTEQILGWQDAWYSNPVYDAMYKEQQSLVNLAERQAVIHEMQRMVYRDVAYIVYQYPYFTEAVRIDRFTNWGNWAAHPGLGLIGFGNVFLMLQLEPIEGAAPPNTCPTTPVIQGGATLTVYVNDPTRFTATSVDAENDPLTWTWDWDDATTTVVDTAGGVSESSAAHAWTATRTYSATVSVDDTLCGQVLQSAPVTVTVVPAPAELGWLVGTVTDTGTGQPIANAIVQVGQSQQATAADGTYNISLAPGTYTVTVSKALYASQSRSVAIVADTETQEDFALVRFVGWIAGTVTDASSGAALSNILIEVINATSGAKTPLRTNATGQYNASVAPGTYTVNTTATGYFSASKTGQAVTAGRTTRVDFALTLVPAAGGLDPLVVGGSIAAILVVIIAAAAYLVRRRKKEEEMPPPMPPAAPPAPPQP